MLVVSIILLGVLASVTQINAAQPISVTPCQYFGWSQPAAVLELTYQQPASMTTLLNFNSGIGPAPSVDSLLCVSFAASPRFENGNCDLVFTTGLGEVPPTPHDRTLYMSILTPSNMTAGAVSIFAFNVFLLHPVFAGGTARVDLPALAAGQSYMLPADVANALESQNGVRVSIRGLPGSSSASKRALTVGRYIPTGNSACPEAGYVGDNLFAPASDDGPEILIPPSYLKLGARFVVMTSADSTSNQDGGGAPPAAAGLHLSLGLYNNCSVLVNQKRSPCSVWGGVCKFPCDGMNQCDARGKLPKCVCAHGYSGLDCNTMSCTGGTQEPCEGSHGVFHRECALNNQTSTASWSACKPAKCDVNYAIDASGYYCMKQGQPPAPGNDTPHISTATFGLSLTGAALLGGVVACAIMHLTRDSCRKRACAPHAEREGPAKTTKEEPLLHA
jgi:hypothetical protein